MTTSGTYTVYKITNQSNGKFYIGITSRCVLVRWEEHKRHAKHSVNNGHFYRAIKKYGHEVFSVKILSTYKTAEEAKNEEIKLISTLRPSYNSTLGGDGTVGHIVSTETRNKMRILKLGNKNNLGKKWTEEQKAAMSLKKKGCKAPPITEKMQNNRVENCKKHAKESCKKVVCLNDNKQFDSVKDAANFYKLCKSTVSAICKNKRNAAYGVKFAFAEAA